MSELTGQQNAYDTVLTSILIEETSSLATAWIDATTDLCDALAHDALVSEAERFLRILVHGIPSSSFFSNGVTAEKEALLRQEYPHIFRTHMQLALADILIVRAQRTQVVTPKQVLAYLQEAIAQIPLQATVVQYYSERLAQLNQLSWRLNSQHDQDSIMQLTLESAPSLVGAASSAIWLWDTDQQAPLMVVTAPSLATACDPPESLLRFLRQTCENCCAFTIDEGEADDDWPPELLHRAIAFIPLPAEDGCMGILTVHHHEEENYSHDDIMLLSSLGNLAATALRNVQLHANERHLVSLLQTSIRQVVAAATNRSDRYDEFVESLLQVAEGLTRAGSVCAVIRTGDREVPPLTAVSGVFTDGERTIVTRLAETIESLTTSDAFLQQTGSLRELFLHMALDNTLPTNYAYAKVKLEGRDAGIVLALKDAVFAEDQLTFLCTIAEQIGIGIENQQQSANLRRLLFELSNVNYVSETITSTFDPHRIFSTINHAACQALNAPIALCGWLEDDGSIQILPGTTVGIPSELEAQLGLTYNNAVLRTVLEKRVDVQSGNWTRQASTAFPKLRQLHVKEWICVPMMVKPRVRGIMLVADVRTRKFSRREVALLSTYANQAALAMENSLLYEQVDRQLQQIEQLYQVTRSLGSTLDLDAILKELLQAATTALQLPAALVCLADEHTGTQHVVAFSGLHGTNLSAASIMPSEGILGVVGQRGEVIISSNLARDGRSPLLRNLARMEKLVSSLTVPLQVQGRILGTLTVIARDAHEFLPAHEQLMLAMATEAAVAVHNARLYEQEREHAQMLRALIAEVTSRVTTSLALVEQLLTIAPNDGRHRYWPATDTTPLAQHCRHSSGGR